MKALVLEDIQKLKIKDIPTPEPDENQVVLKVSKCTLCRTDAKMWHQGQRDLILPRILGHEVCLQTNEGKKFIVWPGYSCGTCNYCKNDNENLCDKIQVFGFHLNGGLAEYMAVPKTTLLPLPANLPENIACLAEPLACAINALEQVNIAFGSKVLIYGAGFVGLVMALAALKYGAIPFIKEKNPVKFQKSEYFRKKAGIDDADQYINTYFDAVINAAPGIDTFTEGLSRLDKGGYYCLFSGITDKKDVNISLINDIHYRQLKIVGAYGCTYRQMEEAFGILTDYQNEVNLLIEEKITLEQVPDALEKILTGEAFKYVVEI